MKKLLILIGLTLGLTASAQTNIAVPDLSPLLTNKVNVVLTSNQWETLRFDFKLMKAKTGTTNLNFAAYQDILATRLMSNQVNVARATKLGQLRALLAREPSEAKVDAALQALK